MTDLAVTAARLLKANGEPVTLTDGEAAVIEFDPITGDEITPDAPISITAFGYPSRYNSDETDGTNIRSGDIRLILEITDPRPQVGWTATVDGITYRIMDVKAIRKAGKDKLNICQIRSN
jgi:hypothetical protein